MQTIDYDHSRNSHELPGPLATLRVAFGNDVPASLLDIGCGTGTWLKAAQDIGVNEIAGVEGVETDTSHVNKEFISLADLTRPFDLKRKFDVALCLEVAEHLDEEFAETLIQSIVRHSDRVLFSAAAPKQLGQHHVNCQWPSYWQRLFNSHGFRCDDAIRWQIWADDSIEYWYRQNIFWAVRDSKAGSESRIKSVVHPLSVDGMAYDRVVAERNAIANGSEPGGWYVRVAANVIPRKIISKVRRY